MQQISRRTFLSWSTTMLASMAVSGCGSPTTPPPTATSLPTAKPFATVDLAQIKEITMSIPLPENTPYYDYVNWLFTEAFKRLGIKFILKTYPLARCSEEVNLEQVDGEVGRIYEFTANGTNPNHLRVEATSLTWETVIYAVKANLKVESWQSLKTNNYRVGYPRGNKRAGDMLTGLIAPDKLVVVDEGDEQGFKMLLADRFDIFIANGGKYTNEVMLQTVAFKGKGIYETGVLETMPLYPYLHKKYATLAPKLAATIKEMESEGLMKQYAQDIIKKYGLE